MSKINTIEDLLNSVEKTYQQGMELIYKKNRDYAGDGDPFKNFNACKLIGVAPEKALLVRMMDKMTRISNLLDKPGEVKDESITDTLVDLCNYSAILRAYLECTN